MDPLFLAVVCVPLICRIVISTESMIEIKGRELAVRERPLLLLLLANFLSRDLSPPLLVVKVAVGKLITSRLVDPVLDLIQKVVSAIVKIILLAISSSHRLLALLLVLTREVLAITCQSLCLI
jgi:hypothetical protein